MFLIEIKDSPLNWIAAVHIHQHDAEAVLEQLPSDKKAFSTLVQIPQTEFPIYAVERIVKKLGGSRTNVFQYCSAEELIQLVKDQQTDDRDYLEPYFTWYIIEGDYTQEVLDKSYMGSLDHTHVDNHFLKYGLSYKTLEEEIKPKTIAQLSNNWNFDRLDSLFDKYLLEGTQEQKNELAEDGYLGLVATMTYDYACGKLTEVGVELMLPMVEKAEKLLGEELHYQKGYIYSIVLDQAIGQENTDLLPILYASESEFLKHIEAKPSEAQDSYEELAKIYSQSAGALLKHRQEFWEKSLFYFKKAILENPSKITWNLYLDLLYIPYDGRKFQKNSPLALNEAKLAEEIKEFKSLIERLESNTPILPFAIALAHKHLMEMLEWHNLPESIFPQEDYHHWLEKAKHWDGTDTNRMQLTEAGHFFHNEGKRLNRIDLLTSAAKHYQRLIDHIEAPAFEVYYLASVNEDIAVIHARQHENEKADAYMNAAMHVFRTHLELIKSNFSTYSHFSDFLERSFHYKGKIEKPSFEELKEVALQNEVNSNGMYSSPFFMLVRLAMYENDEERAIYYVSKTLILHELCIESEIVSFRETITHLPFKSLITFLDDTIRFMGEVRKKEDYYYDPKIKWDDLQKMSQKEVIKAWIDSCK